MSRLLFAAICRREPSPVYTSSPGRTAVWRIFESMLQNAELATDRSWLDGALARFDADNDELVARTRALLDGIIAAPARHARLINTLSLLEHMGSHKIMATQHSSAIDQADAEARRRGSAPRLLHEAPSGENGRAAARVRRRRLARTGGGAHVLPAARERDGPHARRRAQRARGVSLYVDDRRVPRVVVLRLVQPSVAARAPRAVVEARARRGAGALRRHGRAARSGRRARRRAHVLSSSPPSERCSRACSALSNAPSRDDARSNTRDSRARCTRARRRHSAQEPASRESR